ncbi:DUF4349 domain-containing protein [Microbacterium sp. P07]|uniref:DUF4349 domain-containing protein n=1 Tax=Microbacterium sp. P07 TaxID=3366952 RepID=UPI003745644C
MNTTSPAESGLPEIDDDRIDAMERVVFARISDARSTQRSRRGRWWLGGVAAAAVIVVAVAIAPYISVGGANESSSGASSADAPARGLTGVPADASATTGETSEMTAGSAEASGSAADSAEGSREIATTASATLIVDDVADAAREIGADAEARGGFVESANIDASATVKSADSTTDSLVAPYPYPGDGAWITVRVPADELTDAVNALDRLGEVTTSSIGRQDVTDQAIDLRARVAASEASVARLTELIGQAESVTDLIAAESALADRQATLESDRRQLESLEGQVSLSTLSVQLSPVTPTVEADPAGFGDGIAAGWNGLIATLNGIVIAVGFLLPWLAVAAIVGAVVWGAIRLVRRARAPRSSAGSDSPTE